MGIPLLGQGRALSPPLLLLLLLPLPLVNDTRRAILLRRAASPCDSAAKELLGVSAASSEAFLTVLLFRDGRLVAFERDRAGKLSVRVLLVGDRRTPIAPTAEVGLGLVPEPPSASSSLSVEDETGPREGRGLGAVSPVDDSSPLLSPPPPPTKTPLLQLRLLASLSSLVALLLGEPGHPGPQLRQGFRGGLT